MGSGTLRYPKYPGVDGRPWSTGYWLLGLGTHMCLGLSKMFHAKVGSLENIKSKRTEQEMIGNKEQEIIGSSSHFTIISRSCHDLFMIMSRSFHDHLTFHLLFVIISRSFHNHFTIISRSSHDHFTIMSRSCYDRFTII